METYFLNLLGLSWGQRAPLLLRPNPDPARGPERLAHMTYAEYTKLEYLTQQQFDEAYRFTFVRNPWARLVSEYRYRRYFLRFSFRDFVTHHLPEPDMSDKYRHVMPQSEFVFDSGGNLQVDFVGRFENLQQDFESLCRNLGLNPGKLPHINEAGGAKLSFTDRLRQLLGVSREAAHVHYSGFYDDETQARVAELYADDIRHFEYRFERV